MASSGGFTRTRSRRPPARRAGSRRGACRPILLPILIQVLGGLLSLTVAVLERESGSADTITAASPSPDGLHPGGRPDSRYPSDETDDDLPPASSSDAGSVPAGVKLSQGPWAESSRLAAGSRAVVHGPKVPFSDACRRDRLAALPPLVASTPVGGSLSPLSPRGPPAA